MLRIGSDIGGTFTDVVVADEVTGEVRHTKVLTSTKQPADAVVASLDEAGVDLAEASFFCHGTTIVVNALIQRQGATTGVLTTRGFRDLLELRRGARTHVLDPLMDKPEPFVPRRLRTEVDERVLADGTIAQPIDLEQAAAAVAALEAKGVQALAVCFLHSYFNPAHERAVGEMLTDRFPHLHFTLSSDIVPEIKEFERVSTAVLNSYAQPSVQDYLASLEAEVSSRGLRSHVHLMQSNGGLITAKEAGNHPIKILESGPASGAIAAASLGARIGIRDLITFDMGGTTAKSTVVENAEPLVTLDYELFEERDKPGSGWPIRLPMIDIVEVGAGGGSVAWVDESGRLQVGPRSAGSDPGPVCYGRGGVEPTITDAHAVLGNVVNLLGGEFPLDVDAAREAILEKVAKPLGLDVEDAAAGILHIASAKVADLLRQVTVARGRDPRRFALVTYGGAGPLEAASILEELNIPLAIVPPTPGTFSALGLLDANVLTYTARTCLRPLNDVGQDWLSAQCRDMGAELATKLEAQGVTPDQVRIDLTAELRYLGQFHQVSVPLLKPDSSELVETLVDAFHSEHLRLFSYETRHVDLELVSIRARATGVVPRLEPPTVGVGMSTTALVGTRKVRFRNDAGPVETAVYDRAHLGAGTTFNGPAVVDEYTSTTIIPPGFGVEVDVYGNLLMRKNA